jgi:hypothetical protein
MSDNAAGRVCRRRPSPSRATTLDAPCRRTMAAADVAAVASIRHLIALAQSDSGQARRTANFLLAWWNALHCGGFDLTELWADDKAVADDMLGSPPSLPAIRNARANLASAPTSRCWWRCGGRYRSNHGDDRPHARPPADRGRNRSADRGRIPSRFAPAAGLDPRAARSATHRRVPGLTKRPRPLFPTMATRSPPPASPRTLMPGGPWRIIRGWPIAPGYGVWCDTICPARPARRRGRLPRRRRRPRPQRHHARPGRPARTRPAAPRLRRRAKLTAIPVEHLAPCERGLRLTLPNTKGERTGRGVSVAIPYGTTDLCPNRALRARQDAAGITAGGVPADLAPPGRPGRPQYPLPRVGAMAIDTGTVARIIQTRAAAPASTSGCWAATASSAAVAHRHGTRRPSEPPQTNGVL